MPVAQSAGLSQAQAYLESAASKYARGAREGAIAAARRAVELEPDWLDPREYLGDLLAVSGDLDGAVREWLEAAARTPEGPRLRGKAATELAKAGRAAEAMPLLEEAIREKPSFAHIAVTLGVNAFQAGDAAMARGWWEMVLRHAPEDLLALYNMGNLAAAQKRYDEAIDWWKRAVAVNPAHMDSLHNLALAYLYTRNFAAAKETVAAIRAQGGTPDPGVVQAIEAGGAASP
jgi:tetratricopeptide (TPR) repeat protein